MRTALSLSLLLAAAVLAPGCTTEQRTAIHDARHRHECSREVGRTDRERCASQFGS